MGKQKHFDEILVNITHTGEELGQMTFSLSNVAEFYQTELNNKVDAAMEVIPSSSIITIGLIADPIVVTAYLPILEISSGAGLFLCEIFRFLKQLSGGFSLLQFCACIDSQRIKRE